MKTGYFYQLREAGLLDRAVCIARTSPKGVSMKHIALELAPSWALMNDFRNDVIDEAEYIKRYKEQLSKLDAGKVYNKLIDGVQHKDPILMCHCSPKYFCHRHLVADWFEDRLGVKIDEYKSEDMIRKDGNLIKKAESQPQQVKLLL